MEQLTTILGVVVTLIAVVGSSLWTRKELKQDIADLRAESRADIRRLDDRIYGLAVRLEPHLGQATPRPEATQPG